MANTRESSGVGAWDCPPDGNSSLYAAERFMSSDDKDPLVSLSGGPIYHHGRPSAFAPPCGEESLEAISEHIARHLAPVHGVFHEIVSDTVHIDVHQVKPTAAFPFWRLITSGMSDLPMTVPPGAGAPAHMELMITLPANWRLGRKSLEDERWYWPVRLIKSLARLPHKYQTWLGVGHTVPNGDPAKRYARNTRFTGAIIRWPISAPDAFHTLEISSTKVIHFFAVVPLYSEEMDLKLRAGTDALTERFNEAHITDVVDLRRPNVGK